MATVYNAREALDQRLSRSSGSSYPHRYTEFPSLLLINDTNDNKRDIVSESKTESNGKAIQFRYLRYPTVPPNPRNSDSSTRIDPKYPARRGATRTTRQTPTILPSIQEYNKKDNTDASVGLRVTNDHDTKKKYILTAEFRQKNTDKIYAHSGKRQNENKNQKHNEVSFLVSTHRDRLHTDRTKSGLEKTHLKEVQAKSHQSNIDDSNRRQNSHEPNPPYKSYSSNALFGKSNKGAVHGGNPQVSKILTVKNGQPRNIGDSYQQYYINNFIPKKQEMRKKRKSHLHPNTVRSAYTTPNVLRTKTDYTIDQNARSKSATRTESQKNNQKLPSTYQYSKVYNSVSKIPVYPKPTSDTSNETKHSAKSSTRDRKDTDRSHGSSNESVHLSLDEIIKYRKTAAVYMNERWQNTRKEQFYRKLEEIQMKRWRDQKLNHTRHHQKLQQSKKEQMKQLRFIRNKHQNTRTRRLSTQHVKWKYVLGGNQSDRKQYGLPSEYYTHYGFSQKDLESPSKLFKKVASYEKRNTKSATEEQSANTALVPNEKERNEIRKRNKERYDHIFTRRSSTQTDLMESILKKGSYTVEIEEEIQPVKTSISETESDRDVPNKQRRNSKPLLKRKSRLVVGNIVDEARQMLDTLDESYSDDFDEDSKLS